ncbi:tyrosine-type recombinase/integrase [Staphylococcus aureus]
MAIYKDTKRNTWYYSIYYTDIYGKPKRKFKRGFKTKKAAKIAEAEMLRTVRPDSTEVKTFDEVFHERMNHTDLTDRTRKNRIDQYNKYFKYNFSQIPIDKITVEQCKDLRLQLINTENLSDEYKKSVFAGFKAIMSYALKNQYININPAAAVESIKFSKNKLLFISREEFDEWVMKMDDLDNKNPVMYRKLVQLLFYTGLRIGEALPLKWEDWDSEKREININKIIDITSGKIRKDVAKTKSSLGNVPVPNLMANLLDEMKEEANPNDEFIFGGKKPIIYATINKAFKQVFREYNSKMTLHTLRHSYATYLINNGVDMYLLMNLMRHATINETISTYSHLYTDRKQNAMKVFD